MDGKFVRGGATHLANDEVLGEALLPYLQAPGVWLILCRLHSGCEPNLDTLPAHWELISSQGASLENFHGSDMYILHYRIHPGQVGHLTHSRNISRQIEAAARAIDNLDPAERMYSLFG